MNKEQKIKILNQYKQADGTIVLPIGLTLNNWSNINAKFHRAFTIEEVVKDIEEEMLTEKEYASE